MDYRIEIVFMPVSDVDRARDFYVQAGFVLDHDHAVSDDLRFVQLTPPGSACSVVLGTGIIDAAPGSSPGVQMVVGDADAALAELRERGIEAQGVQDQPWGRFVTFADPDGNPWTLQQLPDRTGS
jgi:catechol 2,3-dioxygenase-like lactoylglutathione lyase family enzyme